MRPIFFNILILFLLAACGTPAPQVTVTSEVTVTLTPVATFTATPTATFTPTPAFSPEVEEMMADPEKSGISKEVLAFLTDLKAGGYGTEVTADNKINIPGVIEIDQTTGKTERTYPFTLPDGKVIQLTTSGQVGVDVTIVVDENGDTVVKTEGWKYEQKTGWTKTKALMPDGITETEHPAYSKMEAMAMWLAETLKFKNQNWQDANSPERAESTARANQLIEFRGSPKTEFEGITYVFKYGKGVGDSRLYLVDEYGKPVKSEDGKIVEMPIGFISYVELESGQSNVAWEGEGGENNEIMLDAKLGTTDYYREHGTTPFTLTQGEYDAIMASLTSAN